MDTNSKRSRDAWLALRCQLGEASAYRELVAEFERPLAYFVAKLIGDRDAAWDVLQLVWIRVFRQIGRLQNPDQVRSWLYRIAHGLAVDHLRKRDSTQRIEREYAEQNPEAETGEVTRFDSDEIAAVHRALDELDLRLREVLTLFFLEDLSIAEVASIVGCPEGTVKSRLFHGRQALKQRLRVAESENGSPPMS